VGGLPDLRTHNRKIYCNERCSGTRLTDADRLAINLFRQTCRRYYLPTVKVFSKIAHCYKITWLRFSKPEKYSHISKERKDRYLLVIKKFIADLKAGWYDVDRFEMTNRWGKFVAKRNNGTNFIVDWRRRRTPGQPYCPLKIPTCRGAFLVGDCPRNLRDCPKSGF
jgi:hypothetical protein